MITTATQGLAHMTCRAGCSSQECYDSARLVAEAVERARVVGVLDAESAGKHNVEPFRTIYISGHYRCFSPHMHVVGIGATVDEARAAAAKAIEAGELG